MIAPTLRKRVRKMLRRVSTSEFIWGLILYGKTRWFTDPELQKWIRTLGLGWHMERRFGLHPSGSVTDSWDNRLFFLSMAAVEENPYAPGPHIYRRRRAAMAALEGDLRERGVVPRHQDILRELADNFWRMVDLERGLLFNIICVESVVKSRDVRCGI